MYKNHWINKANDNIQKLPPGFFIVTLIILCLWQ